jgi:hypothetical protein
MGWVGDALKVLFGLDEDQRAWREKVAAAEHHLRWGIQSRQARDFERVLEILAECPEGEPPSAHYRYRRERTAAEAHLWLARLALDQFLEQAQKTAALRTRVKGLEADGSLISAREERRRLEEMEHEARALPDLSGEKRARHAELFGKFGPVVERHRAGAGEGIAALRAASGLAAEDQAARDELGRQFEAALAALEADWKALSAAGAPTAPAPAPGKPRA